MGAIRLFLALSVTIAHTANLIFPSVGPAGENLTGVGGGQAVMLFFILSGFLISYVLEARYADDVLSFYRSRFLRIFPLWWFVLGVLVAIGFVGPWLSGSSIDKLLTVVLFGTDWRIAFTTFPEPYVSVFPRQVDLGWSLGVEVAFYVFAPLLLRPKIALVAFATSITLRGIIAYNVVEGGSAWHCLIYYFFPTLLPFFLAGHLARKLYHSLNINPYLGLVFLPISYYYLAAANGSVASPSFYEGATCFAFALPAVFATTKNNALMNRCGDLTYPLYLIHYPLLVGLLTIAPQITTLANQLPGSPLIQFGLATAVACSALLALAAIVHMTVEQKAERILALCWPARQVTSTASIGTT